MPAYDPADLYPPLPTDLRSCCWRGDLEGVRRAVAAGEAVNQSPRPRPGYPPLFLAAARGHIDVVRFLLDQGADPNIVDHIGVTPLMGVCYEDRVEVAELLLARGADVHARSSQRETPLMFAAMYGRREIAELYLAVGAERWETNERGHTPGSFARVQGYMPLAQYIEAFTEGAGAEVRTRMARNGVRPPTPQRPAPQPTRQPARRSP